MNLPKQVKDYCKKCDSHTLQSLKAFKPRAPRTLAWGTRENVRKHKQGYGGKAEFTAMVKKQSKKPVFLAECTKCHTKHYFVIPKRMKKVELKAS
ncbi:MAG: hypothetical protein HY392_01940 [Candidatus Diapherotrites archaeon]|nr:hypothetical protein [Candidatus Diapherotrites archaeon]